MTRTRKPNVLISDRFAAVNFTEEAVRRSSFDAGKTDTSAPVSTRNLIFVRLHVTKRRHESSAVAAVATAGLARFPTTKQMTSSSRAAREQSREPCTCVPCP